MSPAWFLFASMTVVGSVGYNIGMKLGGHSANPFGFLLVMTGVIFLALGVCCVAAKTGFNVDVTQGLGPRAMKCAVLCGLSAALIDVGYFLALRTGSMVATQVFWTVGGMGVLAVIAALFFSETMTLTKVAGIAFGIVSVLLITKAP